MYQVAYFYDLVSIFGDLQYGSVGISSVSNLTQIIL